MDTALKDSVKENEPNQLEGLEDIIKQIVPDPMCRKANCYGRGYVGVVVSPDGKRTVLLCQCARFGETDYLRAIKRVDGLAEAFNVFARATGEMILNIKALSAELAVAREEFQSQTFSGRMKSIFKFSGRKKSDVPVQGTVKA